MVSQRVNLIDSPYCWAIEIQIIATLAFFSSSYFYSPQMQTIAFSDGLWSSSELSWSSSKPMTKRANNLSQTAEEGGTRATVHATIKQFGSPNA